MTAGAPHSASADAHSSNATASTLNYALGRRHMKSWMTAAVDRAPLTPAVRPVPSSHTLNPAASVSRKRGRPRIYPLPIAADLHATDVPPFEDRPTTAPLAERLPSSNSTSPQLANVVTGHTRSRSYANLDITVFPSPTPSEEDAHHRGLEIQGLGTRQAVDIDAFHVAPAQSPSASSPVSARTTPNLPPPKRPAGEDLAPVDKRARVDTAQFPANTPAVASPLELLTFSHFPRPPSAPHTHHRSPSLGQVPSRSPSSGHGTDQQTASPQLIQTVQPPGQFPNLHTNAPPVQQFSVPGAPARQTYVRSQLRTQPFGELSGPQQLAQPAYVDLSRQRASYQNDWYTIDICVREMKSFNAKYPATLRNPKDTIRLMVLEEAVRSHDWAYLTLHQYYCLMTFSTQDLPLTLQRMGNLQKAHALMRHVLDDNMLLSPAVRAFFCAFPFTVENLASTWREGYQRAELEFAKFVNYSPHVETLKQVCERRRIPPTPREFYHCAITSLTFQRLLFTSIIRLLWVMHPNIPENTQFEGKLLNAFNKARYLFEQRRAVGGLGGHEQVELEITSWEQEIYQLTTSFGVELQRRGLPPLIPASPRFIQQHQQHVQPQIQPQRPHAAHSSVELAMSRRRQPPPPPATFPRSASQTQPQSHSVRGSTALLPPSGVMQPQQRVPVPSRFSLHQAHLRSPVLKVLGLTSTSYFFWQGFVHKPRRLMHANTAIEKLSFTWSAEEARVMAGTLPTVPGATDTRLIDETHKVIRLRCVKWPADPAPQADVWAVADCSWVPHSCFTFNDAPLELRKKLHNGKDLPVDLTGLARTGENILEVSVMSNSDDHAYRDYMVAIEFLGIMTKPSIEKRCREMTIAATAVVNEIKRKLSPSIADDDDIVLMESTLTINLRDPFSASKICDTPVRAKACLHNECFDLDTFLETRPRKGDVTTADQWRCPICKADARPHVLAVDGFLVEVYSELERKGLLHTKAIIVSQDGSWKPKPEERDPHGVSDRDTPEPDPAAAPAPTRTRPAAAYEIIDLDSD